jgi:sporulation protein YlmC with PRC-barrel domain
MRLDPGRAVRCSDDVYGELADIVIDPTANRVTHLVVQPHHDHGRATLVPTELVGEDGADGISLRCTVDEVARLPHVQEFAYLRLDKFPVEDPEWDVGIETVLAMPYYEPVAVGFDGGMPLDPQVEMTYDRVPKGEVEIQRASAVMDASGHRLGHVDGFVVDADGQISHVVLERGHLFGRREITIPIGDVATVETDGVTLGLDKDAVERLPAVRLHRWNTHGRRASDARARRA